MQITRLTIRRNLYRFLGALFVLLHLATGHAGDLEDGQAAFTARDYQKALRLLEPVARLGDASAQVTLGQMHRDGLGVPRNHSSAFAWYRLAAAQNHRIAQSNLGWMYREGHGISKDLAESIKWFKLSVDQNFATAQSELGHMHRLGQGTPQNYAEALRLYRLSADQGSANGQNATGFMFMHGLGVEKNHAEALRWFRLSAAQDYSHAQANLGRMFEMGWGVAQDFKEASNWYTKAAKQGNDYAKSRLEVAEVKAAANAPAGRTPPTIMARRRALVIGNDNYRHVPQLLNAREDARAIAQGLTQVGYQVMLKLDLDEKEMKIALRSFKAQVEGGDEVLIFYAGHGVQIGAANYLLPIDIAGESEEQVKDDGIQLQRILDDMSERKTKFTLAMIDACRDNPFKKSGRALGGRGLSPTTAATGQMVIFSAGAGQQALDRLGPNDTDKNGLFTRIFIKEMQKPGVSIDRVVRNVRNDVVSLAKSVGHEQVPAIYDQVVGEFYFRR